jgi:hypothetical protein
MPHAQMSECERKVFNWAFAGFGVSVLSGFVVYGAESLYYERPGRTRPFVTKYVAKFGAPGYDKVRLPMTRSVGVAGVGVGVCLSMAVGFVGMAWCQNKD